MKSKLIAITILTSIMVNMNVSELSKQQKGDTQIPKVQEEVVLKPEVEVGAIKIEKLPLTVDFSNVMKKSNVTVEEMEKALEGTKLQPLANSFIEAENKYGINAIILASVIALESGWGTSERSIKDNNLSGYAVYNDSSKGTYFKTQQDCVLATGKLIASYTEKDNHFYKGNTVDDINETYSASPTWGKQVKQISNELLSKIQKGDN